MFSKDVEGNKSIKKNIKSEYSSNNTEMEGILGKNIKTEIDTDSEFGDGLEVKSLMEISKTEYIYDEYIVNTAERFEDDSIATDEGKIPMVSIPNAPKQETLPTDYKCGFCHKIFDLQQDLIRHERTFHPKGKAITCQICSKSFARSFNLKCHMRKHTGERPFACLLCDKTFIFRQSLKEHEKIHMEPEQTTNTTMIEESPDFICEICSKSFKTNLSLKCHMRRHTGERPFACSLCSKTFRFIQNLKIHEKSDKHAEERPWACSWCDKTYIFRKSLKVHEKTHKECSQDADISEEDNEVKQSFEAMSDECLYKVIEGTVEETNIVPSSSKNNTIKTENMPKNDITCEICSKSFARRFNLKCHMRLHTGEHPIACLLCDKTFRFRKHLKEHEKIHKKCGKDTEISKKVQKTEQVTKTASEKSLKQLTPVNILNDADEKILETNIETNVFRKYSNDTEISKKVKIKQDTTTAGEESVQLFPSMNILNDAGERIVESNSVPSSIKNRIIKDKGIKSQDLLDKDLTCKICCKSFKSKGNLNYHMKRHSGERPYVCSLCDKSFVYRQNLRMHKKNHKANDYTCEICSKSFVTGKGLKCHMREHTGKHRFGCLWCDNTYASLQSLSNHELIHKKYNGIRNVQNINDEKINSDRISLNDNNETLSIKNEIHSESESEVKINTGPSSSKVRATKNMRIIKRNSSMKDTTCEICSKSFQTRHNLKYHQKRVHTGDRQRFQHLKPKKFPCKQCPKRFINERRLKLHFRMEHKVRPFACSLCDKTFAQSIRLQKHQKKHDLLKINPIKCEICSKTFKRNFNLKCHMMKIHNGERPYACLLCDKTFRFRNYLRKHEKEHKECKKDTRILKEDKINEDPFQDVKEESHKHLTSNNVVKDVSDEKHKSQTIKIEKINTDPTSLTAYNQSLNIKKELHSDNESQDELQVESVIETFKTEFIYDEAIANTKPIEDSFD